MKSRWVFQLQNLSSHHFPSCASSLISAFKTKLHRNPDSQTTATLVLNNVDISLLLSLCGKDRNFQLGSSLHASLIKNPEFFHPENHDDHRNVLVVWNSLLSMYLKCGKLRIAVQLFDDMHVRDTVSWNTMISGFLRNGELDSGFGYFKQMCGLGCYRFDKATLTSILAAFDGPEFCHLNKMMHGLVVLNGFERETAVGNALITSYCKCGCFLSGRRVFDEMFDRNVITWTAMISGLAQNEYYVESLELFLEMRGGVVDPNSMTYLGLLMACSGLQAVSVGRQIHGLAWKLGIQSELCIESALMDMYSKCGSVEEAWKIFESTEELDEISMTVILVGFAQNRFEDEAIHIFVKMIKAGIDIDPNMVSAVLGVFGVDTSLGLGKQLHSLIVKKNFGSNSFVGNGLINMYSKCGELEDSVKVFSRMPQRNSISWNSMIAAFARHGDGSKALQLYEKMNMEGVQPTDVTFLSLLHACSHVGFVERGMEFLKSMNEDHGMSPRPEHYACVVDMLGRAGHLTEAKSFIEKLPENPGVLVWQALLGACCIHGDSEIGKYAADQLLLAAPETPAPYVLLANIYSSEGRWKERARTIKGMKEMGVTKETGISWIEIEKKVQSFVVGDRMHPQAEPIYRVLGELFRLMTDEGYVPDESLQGSIPVLLGLLSRLDFSINLSNSHFEGQLPASIGKIFLEHSLILDFIGYGNLGEHLYPGGLDEGACKLTLNEKISIATEYGQGIEVSAKRHVHCFGVILLEMMTGKRPTSNMFLGEAHPTETQRFALLLTLNNRAAVFLRSEEREMEGLLVCGWKIPPILPFQKAGKTRNRQKFTVKNCREDAPPLSATSTAYTILGVQPSCSAAELKAAFRAKVKQFHPDVNRNGKYADMMIRRVIQAYEMLSSYSRSEIIERECVDPFDNPECEAFDVFVNEVLCVGKGCLYSCVQRAPHAFTYASTGTARATSQGFGDDYQVQLAVGQCPRSCIHYVTPSQRIILEELLDSIINTPYDSSPEADLLYSLIVKAMFENNRYQKPKKQPKASTQHVDWF
ncbi:pentatricopeptide repeat-containing protein [Pyrus ussuriensis x Pyrus communis]|uniref:Pentatricopeptide repeat-containing protein n=1 Tax=Pyrus ussuriensis x Pyrus communis TaxID=2448454 RepID=A0A5N5HQN4_9ROSA|nr:pentatricopeptide repeat-containing protein [Pyrus ussuriensis x Pyrus communis]